MSRSKFHRSSRKHFAAKAHKSHRNILAGLVAAGLCVPALAQSERFPKYTVGPQPNGSYVVSNGTIITPAGTQVNLGIRVRAKAVALNPNSRTHTAAVLTMGTSASNGNGAVEVFDTKSGAVLQSYNSAAGQDSSGSHAGITYTPDGKYLLFSQDSSFVAIAKVGADGKLSDYAHVSVPIAGSLYQIAGTPFDYKLDRPAFPTVFPAPTAATLTNAGTPSAQTPPPILSASRSPRMAKPRTLCSM